MAPTVAQRGVGAIVGSVVGDAAARPTHWVYAPPKMAEIIQKHTNIEFVEENYCPFYKLPTGEQSCYGDQVYALLWSMVDSKGWNVEDFQKKLVTVFGPDTDYDVDKKLGREATKEDQPIEAHWRHSSIKHFLTQYKEKKDTGNDDNMADGLAKVAPLVALYAGDDKLLKYVEEMVNVTQKNDLALKYAQAAARLLEMYVLKGPDEKSLDKLKDASPDDVKEAVEKAIKAKSDAHMDACLAFGQSCSNPGNFQNMIHCLVNSDGDFLKTMRFTLVGTGDNCGRCTFIGACMGAQVGIEGVPAEWIKKTKNAAKIKELAEKLVALRK